MSYVKCNRCDKTCVPRLWNYSPLLSHLWIIPLRYMKSQHLCPFCGACMYESGGEFTFIGKIFVFYGLIPFPLMLVIDSYHFPWWAYLLYCIVATPLIWRGATRSILKSKIDRKSS